MEGLYRLEKQELVKEQMKYKLRLRELFPKGIPSEDGIISVDNFIHEVTTKSLLILSRRYFPPVPHDEATHLWIGINPPPNTINVKDLFNKTIKAVKKYSFLQKAHIFCVESHTRNKKTGLPLYRPHIHLLSVHHEKPGRVRTALQNFYQLEPASIEAKCWHAGLLYDEHVKYVKGIKQDSKAEEVSQDIDERIALDIPDYVSNL